MKEEFMYVAPNGVKIYNDASENKFWESKDSKESKNKDSYNNLLRGLRKAAQVTAFSLATCAIFESYDFGYRPLYNFGYHNLVEAIAEGSENIGFSDTLSINLAIGIMTATVVAGSALAASLL